MRCRDFGEYVEAVRFQRNGDVSLFPPQDVGDLVRHAATCGACRARLSEARVTGYALGGPPRGGHDHPEGPDAAEVAVWAAGAEVPPDVLACAGCSELLIESIRSMEEIAAAPAAEPGADRVSETTRRRLERLAGLDASDRTARHGSGAREPASRSNRWWTGVAAFVPAAAALAIVVVHLMPASQPWARGVGLKRSDVWRMGDDIRTQVRGAVAEGRLASPLFSLPEAPLAIERDAFRTGRAPRVLSPRWEAVLTTRPVFRWNGGARTGAFGRANGAADRARSKDRALPEPDGGRDDTAQGDEVFLLDANRRFVWSGLAVKPGELKYPADAPALEPGATYYWKVNRPTPAGVLASAYASFRVLDEERANDCERRLLRFEGTPFVAGVIADSCGLYTKAARRFETAAESLEDRAVAERALAAVRAKQGLADGAPE